MLCYSSSCVTVAVGGGMKAVVVQASGKGKQ